MEVDTDLKKAAETRSIADSWISHVLVVVTAVLILVILLIVQPWSGSRVIGVQSYRMTTTLYSADTEDSVIGTFNVAFIAPNNIYRKAITIDGVWELIIIGNDIYTNQPQIFDDDYANMPQMVDFSQVQGILQSATNNIPSMKKTQEMLDTLEEIEELKKESINGIECRHYSGTISMDGKREVDIWISCKDGIVRQIIQELLTTTEENEPITRVFIIYSDINEVNEIEAPLDSNGELLPGWYQASF